MAKGRVLVIDDEPLVLETLRAVLAAEGFEAAAESDAEHTSRIAFL